MHAPPQADAGLGWGCSPAQVTRVAKLLGIDVVYDADLLHIAEELLLQDLPAGWEAFVSPEGREYFHHAASKETQWAHPLEEYYRSLVFMRKEGGEILEKKSKESPPTPNETREMARYLGIDPREEWMLMRVPQAAVNAPLPPHWEEYEDEGGEVYFYNTKTKKSLEHHPLDAYFLELVRQERQRLKEDAGLRRPVKYTAADLDSLEPGAVPEPWMEFSDGRTGRLFFHSFVLNETSYCHPKELIRARMVVEPAVTIQAFFRGWKVRRENKALIRKLAATGIQKIWRGRRERAQAVKKKYSKQEADIMAIQSTWRGHQTRTALHKDQLERAAIRVQARWRGIVDRSKLEKRLRQKGRALPDDLLEVPAWSDLAAPAESRPEAYSAFMAFAQMREPEPEHTTWEAIEAEADARAARAAAPPPPAEPSAADVAQEEAADSGGAGVAKGAAEGGKGGKGPAGGKGARGAAGAGAKGKKRLPRKKKPAK